MANLAEIEAFVDVVEAGGFRAAAARSGRTASALSKRVRALEERLGARLLNRTTRHVAPTDVGRALFDRARAILADLDDAEAAWRRAGARSSRLPPISCACGSPCTTGTPRRSTA